MVGLRGRKLCGGGCEGKLLCVKLSEALSRIINFATISGWTDRRQKLVSSRRRCPSGAAACRVLGCDSSETDQLRRRRRRRRLGGRSVALDDDAAAAAAAAAAVQEKLNAVDNKLSRKSGEEEKACDTQTNLQPQITVDIGNKFLHYRIPISHLNLNPITH